jgi:hypothetical protein
MADFSSGVNAPGGVNYAAPLMNFSNFSNWAADDPYKKIFDQQAQQLNQQAIQKGQNQLDLSTTFKGGLPIDPATGQIDYKKAVSMLAQKGDIGALWKGADAMLSQSATNMSPLLAPTSGGQPAPGGAAPASIPARPLPPPPAGTPQGDTGSGTITDIVTDRMPNQDTTTGQTILKLSQVLGIDPNVPLTPGQLKRAQVLLNRYAPASGGDVGGAPKPQAGDDGATASFDSRFAAAGGGNLPPSANAVSPAPSSAPPRQPAGLAPAAGAPPPAPVQGAPQGAPAPGPQAVPPQPAPAGPQGGPGQPAPQAATGQPAPQPQGMPQVPLPNGYTDPQQAILALRREAARLSANPRAAGQVAELNNWAQRIETSLQPLSVGSTTTLVDPRTMKPIYQGPGAVMMGGAGAGSAPTLDADAERYRQTGTLPPNMGRGIQGQQQSTAIRQRAAEMEIGSGGDPSTWPEKWQQFKAQGSAASAGARVGATREANLKLILQVANAAVPAAIEQSEKVGRTNWVPLNKIIQKGEVMSSDPELRSFGMANLQLAESWARAMNPTGVMRESDREKALEFLNTADSPATYKRLVQQLQVQMQRELDAIDTNRGGSAGTKTPEPGKLTAAQKAAPSTTPGGFSWSVVQ